MMKTIEITKQEADVILANPEGHFIDFKSRRIAPSKLSRTVSALGNAEGGDVYIGIEDPSQVGSRWDGFSNYEDANAFLDLLHNLFPEGEVFSYKFLRCQSYPGIVLNCESFKNQLIWKDSQGDIYLRKGAQNLKQDTFDKQDRLRLNKGISSHEDSKVDFTVSEIIESNSFTNFKSNIVPHIDPGTWLRKQKITRDDNITVAGLVLFADEPQVVLPKAAIKYLGIRHQMNQHARHLRGNL